MQVNTKSQIEKHFPKGCACGSVGVFLWVMPVELERLVLRLPDVNWHDLSMDYMFKILA
jgi:hypothetical protein